jgi:sulfate adenylyltransferase
MFDKSMAGISEPKQKARLISPYGGTLVNLVDEPERRRELIEKAKFLPSMQVSYRTQCDLELLAVGALSPLDRFMGEKDYRSVLAGMRLANGTLFPIPITLPVDDLKGIAIGNELVLRSTENSILAIMKVEELFAWNLEEEALAVAGTLDSRHDLVSEMYSWGKYYVSGPLVLPQLPQHYDFPELRKTPAEIREILERMGYDNVIGFQPSHPMHRSHEALTKQAMKDLNGSLLLHAVVGMTKRGYIDDYTRVRCYLALVNNYYDPQRTLLGLLPLAVRMVGPRAALWHGIINRNYGVNHLIVGRDNVMPGKDVQGKHFYDAYHIQQLFREHEREIGVTPLSFKRMVYVPKEDAYEDLDDVTAARKEYDSISGTKVIEDSWTAERKLPEWFTRPEIAHILHEVNPPKTKRGFCIWLTGLPSSGKSTIADILAPMLMARGKKVTMLDGDRVRTHLTKGLGFTKDDRITNIIRVGFVASEVVKHNGVVLCSLISPYTTARDKVRAMIGEDKFMEVFIDTPLEVCEARDVKGLYALAKKGLVKGLTGVDDPYEMPTAPELVINTVDSSPAECAKNIFHHLVEKGFVKGGDGL